MSETAQSLTIAGVEFPDVLPIRFKAGHKLTEGEASALQQTFAENVRNNNAKVVKAEVEAAEAEKRPVNMTALTEGVVKYATEYQFGVRQERDPVKAYARQLVVGLLKKKLGAKAFGELSEEDREKRITSALAKNPQITKLAEQRVADAKALEGAV